MGIEKIAQENQKKDLNSDGKNEEYIAKENSSRIPDDYLEDDFRHYDPLDI